MDKLELRLSLNTGVKGYWPDPPASHSQIPHVNGHQVHRRALRTLKQRPRLWRLINKLIYSAEIIISTWLIFASRGKCGHGDRGASQQLISRCHSRSGCQWHRDKGGSHAVTVQGELTWVEHRGRAVAVVATIWSIEPSVSARRGKCAQAKWTYSTWRAYRSVFTCLLLQVVQTGRLPFFSSDRATMPTFFCRQGRLNWTLGGQQICAN